MDTHIFLRRHPGRLGNEGQNQVGVPDFPIFPISSPADFDNVGVHDLSTIYKVGGHDFVRPRFAIHDLQVGVQDFVRDFVRFSRQTTRWVSSHSSPTFVNLH